MPPDGPLDSITETEAPDTRPQCEMSSLDYTPKSSLAASTSSMTTEPHTTIGIISSSNGSSGSGSGDKAAPPQSAVSTTIDSMDPTSATAETTSTSTSTSTTIIDEAQECLAQSLLMFLYADLRLLSATGRINTKFETLCTDSDRVPRTSAAEMAQLPRDDDDATANAAVNDYYCEGVSPGQIMAVLIVELRQEVMAQRLKVKNQIKKRNEAGWLTQGVGGGGEKATAEGDDDDDEESDDDSDAGVMNKITDRKGRKEFETDMHALIRSYNNMLSQDLEGGRVPAVKLERMITNPLRRVNLANRPGLGQKRPSAWLRPGQFSHRLFSFDDMEQRDNNNHHNQHQNNNNDSVSDGDDGSKKSSGSQAKKFTMAGMFQGSLKRKQQAAAATNNAKVEMTDVTFDSEKPIIGGDNMESTKQDNNMSPSSGGAGSSGMKGGDFTGRLSLIAEAKSEEEGMDHSISMDETTAVVSESDKGLDNGEHDNAAAAHNNDALQQQHDAVQKSTSYESGAAPAGSKIKSSKLFEMIESWKGMSTNAPNLQSPLVDDCDLHSLKSDPGPNQGGSGWDPVNSATSSGPGRGLRDGRTTQLTKQLTQQLKDYAGKYREDHVLHNKLIIPQEDYETFAGAEDIGDRLMQMTSSMNLSMNLGMSALPESDELSDPGRNMSEKELLDFMTKCIKSRNVDSLDFMADFFRDNTVSQTMVKSKAQVVWLQDWFPIKDCIYAISVDKEKKRVLVVFRGAITRADWSHGFDAALKKGHNPVMGEYEGRKNRLKYHRGFYTYLFRKRKDTGTNKYDEIANKVIEYGNKMIGTDDFTVTVNGYSLGGALSVLFGLHASTDEKFTKNGPVKIFSYGMPMAVSHSFADAFRHQEKNKKVQHARFYNNNDIVAHMPFNLKPTKRGGNFVHVGIDVKLYPVPGAASLWGSRYPRFHYNGRQTSMASYWRAIKMNSLLNTTLPWKIKNTHGLQELQKRLARAILVADSDKTKKVKNSFLASTLDEAYEAMVYKRD